MYSAVLFVMFVQLLWLHGTNLKHSYRVENVFFMLEIT